MVQPRAVLVDILRKRVHRREIVRRRKSGCWGWERTAVQDRSRDGMDPARRNNIAGKGGSAPLRIAHRHSGGGKTTLTESLCRNRLQIGQNFEFLNGIENRAKCEIVDSRIVVVDTVE